MVHLLGILAIPSAILLIVYLVIYLKNKKEIDKQVRDEMNKKFPNGPAKPHYNVFPLNMYNDL